MGILKRLLRLSISKKIIFVVIIPCITIGMVTALSGARINERSLAREIERRLQVSAFSLSQTLLELTLKVEMDAELEEFHTNTGIDATIFNSEVRVASTIPNAVGTAMAADIWAAIQGGDDYFSMDAMVNGVPYFGYYIPFFTDGKYSGAVFTGIPKAAAIAEINASTFKLIGAAISMTIFSVILSIFIARRIARKINASIIIIEQLSNNDLCIVRDSKYANNYDEMERMYNKVCDFANMLRGIIGDTKSIAKDLNDISKGLKGQTNIANTSTDEIAMAVQNVANGAESQAVDTQNVSKQISEIGLSIDNITSDTESLLEAAGHMASIKDATMIDISQVEEINNTLKTVAEDVNTQIDITSTSVEEIRKFIGVIQSIADQTNLLSLNASIEAARAGEFGRGFAVVAGEIHKLADQATVSVSDVSRIINSLMENYALIVNKMKTANVSIKEQSDKIGRTDQSFVELDNIIQSAVTQIEGIKNAAETLYVEKNKILDTIYSLSAISEENSASTEEVTAEIEELNAIVTEVTQRAVIVSERAESLSNNVKVFKVEE